MKRSLALLLAGLLCLLPAPPALAAVTLVVNGKEVHPDVPPLVIEGRTLVPFRAVAEALGVSVSWEQMSRKVVVSTPRGFLLLTVDNRTATLKGKPVTLDVPAKLVQGRVLVPLRFVSETLGADVKWDPKTTTITVTTKSDEAPAADPAIPASAFAAQVEKVVNGDTIAVLVNGKQETVRLIGVDTPETVHPTIGVEPCGPEASAFTKHLLEGRTVHLELDAEERDQYGRLLAYVWLEDGTLFNELLVVEGVATVSTFPPNVKYVERFTTAQEEARTADKGVWGKAACQQRSHPGSGSSGGSGGSGRSGSEGGDRDCSDFATWQEAQDFFISQGGPARDPHRLDSDRDGIACESLQGAP